MYLSNCCVAYFTLGNNAVDEILNAHNFFRSEVGVPPLSWSNNLAAGAQQWADNLAARNGFEHSNVGGENIWYGTVGAYTFTDMVNTWGAEKAHFRNGIFPDVSIDGQVVGHYSQMVWRKTTQVGCGGAAGSDGFYRLVCRYSPPGNFLGEPVF